MTRRAVVWKKALAVAIVVGLTLLIWKYVIHYYSISDREKMVEELAAEYLDEGAALAHIVHRTKLMHQHEKSDEKTDNKVRVPLQAAVKFRAEEGEGKGRHINGKVTAASLSKDASHKVKPENHSVLGNTKLVSRLKGVSKLPQDVVERVEKLVFFIGYQRSGHSIVGSFMDAHPHMVIAHEFMLFTKWKEMDEQYGTVNPLRSKRNLFNTLNMDSLADAEHGWRSGQLNNKNYTLAIDSSWQGRYDGFIRVIGDKSGGSTTTVYTSSPKKFERYLTELRETVGIPIRVLHVVRNPFDMIATDALYSAGKRLRVKTGVRQAVFVSNVKKHLGDLKAAGKLEEFKASRFNNHTLLDSRTNSIARLANGNAKIIQLIGEKNVHELHNSDLIKDPIATMSRLCAFLEVDCPESYLKACANKVFTNVSSTRELVVWPSSTQKRVEELISQHSFFQRYSFDSE